MHPLNPSKPCLSKSKWPVGYTLGPSGRPPFCDPQPPSQVDDFSLRYGDEATLDHVTLDIYRGCITALISPSSCGKTSFLSSVNTAYRPDPRLPDNHQHSNRWPPIYMIQPSRCADVASADRHGAPEADSVSTLNLPQHRHAFTRTWHNASCGTGADGRTSISRCI